MSGNFGVNEQAIRLSEAIITNDINQIIESLKKLVKYRAQVRISINHRKYKCDSHQSIFPIETNKFELSKLLNSYYCQYGHKFCENCIIFCIYNNLRLFLLDNSQYQCLVCYQAGVYGSILLDYRSLEYFITKIHGFEYLENLKVQRPDPGIQIFNQCDYCHGNFINLINICLGGHQFCHNCLKYFLFNLGDQPLICFHRNCSKGLSIQAIISSLKTDPFLQLMKYKFATYGFYLNFCPACNILVELNHGPNGNQTETLCICGAKICNNCKLPGHYGKTCFYFVSNQEFEVIDLHPPKNIDKPENLLEQEFLNAKYAFENFLEIPGSKFKGAKLIVNKQLEERYATKKQEMAKQCGGEEKINEIYIWHGSPLEFYEPIMKEGLKVGGVDGIPIGQGKVHGYGIYCSTTPDTPMSYAKDSNFILACLAMKGIESPNMANSPNDLNTGKFHSYKPLGTTQKNWQVIFTKEQVLPRFLVEFIR